MKFASLIVSACTLLTSCSISAGNNHYFDYEKKVESCIEIEKKKPPITAENLIGLPINTVTVGLYYLKEKRVVDCSANEEIYSLSRQLIEDSDMQNLKHKYLSIGLVARKSRFDMLPIQERNILTEAIKNKGLEVNMIELFDALGLSR